MSTRWVRASSSLFESRDQAVSEAESLSREHTYRVMQIDGHPPAYAIERKLPDREQKYSDDEMEEEHFIDDAMWHDRKAQSDRDERTDGAPSDEEPFDDDDRDDWRD